MMFRQRPKLWTGIVAFALVSASCLDKESIFEVLPLYTNPPPAAKGFLGYTNVSEKITLCGNCHVGQQSEWRQTAHAGAWTTLQESGHATGSCEGCHTVGANGNLVTDTDVGWTATGSERYQDVQCESCHGPGLDHITNPDATQPLPPLTVGVDMTTGCGECHSGTHQPFVEEWAQSRHGSMNPYPQGNAACVQCHEARGIFSAWGINSEYLEKGQSEPIPITCAVCHDPHDPTNSKQLRFPIDIPNEDTNLCMKCHHKRGVPDVNSSRGPHSPQGPLLLGTAGWRPPNFAFQDDTIIGTHGSAANPRMCATCHVTGLAVTDMATGELIFNSTGHLFRAIPCLDAQGIPTPSGTCTLPERNFAACSSSGCHGTPDAARTAFSIVRTRLITLVGRLNTQIGQIPILEFNANDGRVTTAEGARFNAELGAMSGSTAHNPFLVEALLTASIAQVELDYGIVPGPVPGQTPSSSPERQ